MTYEEFVLKLSEKTIFQKTAAAIDWTDANAVRVFVGYIADEMVDAAKITPEIEDDVDAATLKIVVDSDYHWEKVWTSLRDQMVEVQISTFEVSSFGVADVTVKETIVADATIQKIVDMVITIFKRFNK